MPLAVGLSAVVPGASQAYNRHWLKGAIALAAEATVITLNRTWLQEGRDGRTAYQAEAHRKCSALRYAYWLNDYVRYLNQRPGGRMVGVAPVTISSDLHVVDLAHRDGWTDSQRLLVRELFLEIRRVEGSVHHALTGAAFSQSSSIMHWSESTTSMLLAGLTMRLWSETGGQLGLTGTASS